MLLAGTSRDKRVALGLQQVLNPSPVRGAGQSISRTNSTKPGNSRSFTDRCVEPLISPCAPISKEAPTESADRTVANPNPIALDEILLATPLRPAMVAGAVPSPLIGDSPLDIGTLPVEEAAEVAQIAASLILEESVV